MKDFLGSELKAKDTVYVMDGFVATLGKVLDVKGDSVKVKTPKHETYYYSTKVILADSIQSGKAKFNLELVKS